MAETYTFHFALKKKWFDKIASGEKRIEYREAKPFWNVRVDRAKDCRVVYAHFTLGYQHKGEMFFSVAKIERLASGKDTDLAVDAPVWAFHLSDFPKE